MNTTLLVVLSLRINIYKRLIYSCMTYTKTGAQNSFFERPIETNVTQI